MENIYQDSNYRFTDPIRFFKANDPYYFEVDNIPLKQLQENCLWLKDQLRKTIEPKITAVKRGDIDELRPYSTGGDRKVRVKPGRYTARINDASKANPLGYILKVAGEAAGDVDAWSSALPQPGSFPNNKNYVLEAALNTFKQQTAAQAMGMNGLAERAFTWPVVNSDTPVDENGTDLLASVNWFSYGGYDVNIPGGGANNSPFLITEALLWSRAGSGATAPDRTGLHSFDTTNINNGFAFLPRTENHFIKAWRGISRLAIVDVDEEISIEVPRFDSTDFQYVNESGVATNVAGVEQRIDLVFIYSKPVDMSGVNLLDTTTKTKKTITKPTLGIVRGAGIKMNLRQGTPINNKAPTNGSILAHPADQINTNMGFNSTSGNDIAYDIRGSFPSPDDLLNIAPLISEKLEDSAYELVGQSILPVAYVFVDSTSQTVLSTDVIDIRPFFRTAELAYNERAGIAAAFPQLSLANPAVGKAQMDYELKRVYDDLKSRVDNINNVTNTTNIVNNSNTLATGYVFGGWNFGPEGAMYDFYSKRFASDVDTSNDSQEYIRNYVKSKYGIGSAATNNLSIPAYPDWDLALWTVSQNIPDKGLYPNDYINTFIGSDGSIVAGSSSVKVDANGNSTGVKLNKFTNATTGGSTNIASNAVPLEGITYKSYANFNYICKRIKFNRPSWLADYNVNVNLVNCLAQNGTLLNAGSYFGTWVEKGFDEFAIYVAFTGPINASWNNFANQGVGTAFGFPAPSTQNISQRSGDGFSCFVVPVADILASNTSPIGGTNAGGVGKGYVGNPRIAKCTYPTVMWTMTGILAEDVLYHYGNLNGTRPTIRLKGDPATTE